MGVAGATTALTSAKATILTASKINDCNSYWAQGGIIYRDGDPPSTSSSSSLPTLNESLFTDIVKAGGGLHVDTNVPGASPGRTSAAIKLATYGEPTVTALLVKSNVVNFDKADSKGSADSSSSLAYCLEGGHSAPRIIHVGDETGRYITEGLSRECVSAPHVEIKEHTVVTDLVWGKQKQVVGVDILNTLTNERGRMLTSSGVVLASGGYGNIYAESTNPSRGTFNALGNSLALAIRSDVGVKTAGLEYVQFHPTAVDSKYLGDSGGNFLVSEALRGAGAVVLCKGDSDEKDGSYPSPIAGYKRFVHLSPELNDEDNGVVNRGELSPRDMVARAINNKRMETGEPVYIYAGHITDVDVVKRFPSITKTLKSRYGLDLATDLIPITPSSHYTCGGVSTCDDGKCYDEATGESIDGLFCVGEAASTGLHGGNRLASTSLLEGVVWGSSVGALVSEIEVEVDFDVEQQQQQQQQQPAEDAAKTNKTEQQLIDEAKEILANVREIMSRDVSVVRTTSQLVRATSELREYQIRGEQAWREGITIKNSQVGEFLQTLAMARDVSSVAVVVAFTASANRTSAGGHFISN